jgi:hypothetical protein
MMPKNKYGNEIDSMLIFKDSNKKDIRFRS